MTPARFLDLLLDAACALLDPPWLRAIRRPIPAPPCPEKPGFLQAWWVATYGQRPGYLEEYDPFPPAGPPPHLELYPHPGEDDSRNV